MRGDDFLELLRSRANGPWYQTPMFVKLNSSLHSVVPTLYPVVAPGSTRHPASVYYLAAARSLPPAHDHCTRASLFSPRLIVHVEVARVSEAALSVVGLLEVLRRLVKERKLAREGKLVREGCASASRR
jgi:hypothetical protein